MGRFTSGSPNSGLRSSRFLSGLGSGARLTGDYNSSSLALDLGTTSAEITSPAPLFISRRHWPTGKTRAPLMFQGLDETAFRRGRSGSTTFSFIVHFAIVAGVLWLAMNLHTTVMQTAPAELTPLHFTLYDPPPPPVMPVAKAPTGGGGGGQHHVAPPVKGPMPKVVAIHPVTMAPQVIHMERPKLTVEPSAPVKMMDNTQIAHLGMPNSPQVALASQGSGSGSGFGFGMGGGFGSGNGSGAGPGSGGGYGGGIMSVGGGVSAPQVIHSVDPAFTDEARRSNFQGMASIQLIVDTQGNPQNVRVVRHLGMGLDEKAVEAVRQYKFKPAIYQGHPVSVQMIIDVDFRLH